MNTKIKILLVEDHQIMREALRSLLNTCEEFTVVGEASTGYEAIRLATELNPQIIVMDINMPDLNGIDATRQLTARLPRIKIIGLSVHEKGRMIAEMLKAGAHGYIPKTSAAGELIKAIHTVISDKMYVSPDVMNDLVKVQFQSASENSNDNAARLTDREREILQLLAEGYTTKEVGGKLNLSVPTVHTHRQHLMHKINARSIADLVRYAIREGFTTTDE